MALWLFTVSMGNLFTAAVNFFIRNADGTVKMNDQQYFLFFAVADVCRGGDRSSSSQCSIVGRLTCNRRN